MDLPSLVTLPAAGGSTGKNGPDARHQKPWGCLRTLVIPESKISDSIIEQIAGRLSLVTFLDVSYCMNMGAFGLELIGKNCKLLEKPHREMDQYDTGDEPPRDDEAMAIAFTMPNLKHLDIGGHSMTTEGVRKILGACSRLEYLRLWHCSKVKGESLGPARK
ncbi:F-box protein FBW2-like [Neltuma alba]|uniref:F-box protein FBW2-like n=1 Tax=Neltuma alba TaxID=207710 RepID=UPI0010A53347|nr:F-box protein FBW2-like [Prosopis alba]